MIGKLLGAVGLAVVGALAFTSAPAEAGGKHDSFAVSYTYTSGGYYPRHYYPRHYYYPPPRRVVYVAPPPVYYAPPPPRVVYAQPPVVYAPAPPVVQQTLPGGPLASNGYCREYQATTVVNGRQVPTYGTACQQPDGTWQIVR